MLLKLIKMSQNNGFDIEYRVRPEGGVVVTSINGVKYKAKAGNMALRQLTGHQLSAKQQAHLKKATKAHAKRAKVVRQAKAKNQPIPPKPVKPKVKEPKITKSERKQLRKTQKAFRERKERTGKKTGKPTAKRLKQVIKYKGHKEAKKALKEAERYAKGVIYSGQVDFLIQSIKDAAYMNGDDPTTCVNIIKRHKNNFYEEQFILIKERVYDYEGGKISIATLENEIRAAFKITGETLKRQAHYVDVDPFSAGLTGNKKK